MLLESFLGIVLDNRACGLVWTGQGGLGWTGQGDWTGRNSLLYVWLTPQVIIFLTRSIDGQLSV